jgi:co-chaperonin GroES (HSP10)
MRSPVQNIVVRMDKTYEDTIIFPSGVKLYQDTHLNQEWKVSCSGTVVAAPDKLGYTYPDGGKRLEYKGLTKEVRDGDQVIFSYMVVYDCDLRDRDTPIYKNLFYHQGQYFWKVDYQFLLGFVRDEKLIAAQGYVFCELEPLEERPEKVGSLYMPEMTVKERPKGRARVLSVGKAKEGEPTLSLKEGDIVRYSERYAQKYRVLNKDIIILTQDRVLGVEN